MSRTSGKAKDAAPNGAARGELSALVEAAQGTRDEFQRILRDLVEVPGVSMDPAHKADMQKTAEMARELLAANGFEARILPTRGNPLVFGRKVIDPSAPTVTVYNHLDVQPGGPREEWKTDPFQFTVDGDTWYGRGTTDDKGPALTALFGARLAITRGARVNVNFLWELEEEIGSPNFAEGVKAHAAELATDFVVVSDTIWVSRERPASPAGLRGLQPLRLVLETGTTDQHSGVTGGAARNPVAELCDLVGKMVDGRTGQVKIPGFYADWRKPSAAELRDFKRSGFTVRKFMADHLFKSIRTKDATDVMTRIWAKPTLEVHGIAGGYQGPGVKTVVPPRAEAKISMRLVPRMRPAKIAKLVSAFVKKQNKDVQVLLESGLEPYEGTTTGPLADLIRRSMKFAFGKEPVFVREGGSIGAVKTMEDLLDAPVVFLGLSLPEHGYHAPNENYDWSQARGGMVAFAKLFAEAASLPRSAAREALAAKRGR
jgi:acetylornithine deacetylase/succinyl-diaminopimelate desuccinylase-like protein